MRVMCLLMFIILGSSCVMFSESIKSPVEVEAKLLSQWPMAYKIFKLNQNSEVISRPPGVYQLLFEMRLPEKGGVQYKTHCTYYLVPYKNISGELLVVEKKGIAECAETPEERGILSLKNISQFRIHFINNKMSIDFEYRNLETGKNDLIKWVFPIYNLDSGLVHNKFQAISRGKLHPSLTIVSLGEESFDQKNNNYLGKLSDRFSRGSALNCQKVSKECETIGEDRCDECRYGWYEVVDYQCPQGGSKFCGINHCGEKNEPACPRGNKVVGGEDSGICQSDLQPEYNSEHILICQ